MRITKSTMSTPASTSRAAAAGGHASTTTAAPSTAGGDLLAIMQRVGLFVFAAGAVVFLAGTRLKVMAWGLLATAFLYVLTKHNGATDIAAWITQLETWAGVAH